MRAPLLIGLALTAGCNLDPLPPAAPPSTQRLACVGGAWQRAPAPSRGQLLGLAVGRPGELFVTDGKALYWSDDRGTTYRREWGGPRALSFVTAGEAGVFAAGEAGLWSRGGGWRPILGDVWLNGVASPGGGLLYAAGRAGALLRSVDGGRTLQALSPPTAEHLVAVYGDLAGTIVAVGDHTLLVGDRRGDRLASRPLAQRAELLTQVAGSGEDVYVVGLGFDGGEARALVMASHDRGQSFQRRLLPRGETLCSVWARGDHVVAVGTGGLIAHSRDRGASWSEEPSGTRETLAVVAGSGLCDLWIAGTSGLLLRRLGS